MKNNTGWLCPRCQKVHSPYSTTCDCVPQTITSGSSNTLKGFKPQYPSSIIGTFCDKCCQVICKCTNKREVTPPIYVPPNEAINYNIEEVIESTIKILMNTYPDKNNRWYAEKLGVSERTFYRYISKEKTNRKRNIFKGMSFWHEGKPNEA